MEMVTKWIAPAAGFLLTVGLGIGLSRLGKPYNGVLFNAHKLVALAVVVLSVLEVLRLLRAGSPSGLLIAALGIAGLAVVGLFLSGALMSAGKLDQAALLTVHRIAPAVLVVALALAAFLPGLRR
ncbi:MAG: hypothetical protein AB1453_01795 [Chloroflexota bacterium]